MNNTNTIESKTVELKKWTSEAGPRQTKDVQKALSKLLHAGQGTEILTTYTDGSEHRHIQTVMLGHGSPEEEAHTIKRREAYNALHDQFGGTVTRDNCRDIIAAALTGCPALEALRPVRDERKTVDQLQAEQNQRREDNAKQDAERAEKEAQRKAEADKLATEYPYLARSTERHSGGTFTARNIRLVLKREFPGVKFSVTSDYSSVRINWDDGPTEKAVESHVKKFQNGHFNGMEDIYESNISAFNDAFGGVNYVFANRHYTDGLEDKVREAVGAQFGPADNWERETEINREARTLLAETDLTGKGDFLRVYDPQEGEGCHVIEWALEFEETVPAPVTSAPVTCDGCRIEEHTHTKKGFQMWIVVLAGKVDRDDFNQMLDRAKAGGGWYSRAWGSTPGGFAFKEQDKAVTFAATLGGVEPYPEPDNTPEGKERETIGSVQLFLYADGKQFELFGIADTVERANAICQNTGGGVAEETEKGIFIAAMEGNKQAVIFDRVPDRLGFKNTGFLVVRSMNKYFQVIDITAEVVDYGPHRVKVIQVAQLPDGRAVYGLQYGGEKPKPTTPKPESKTGDASKADKLRTLADNMQKTIDQKQAPLTQNATPKRTLEYKGRLIDGDRLERVQRALRLLAGHVEAGTLPPALAGCLTKAKLEPMLRTRLDTSRGYYEIIDTGEYSDKSEAARLLQGMLDHAETPEEKAEAEAKAKEKAIESKILAFAGCKIPGFFVTHQKTAERVIYEADIRPGQTVLEPSAGTGNLADLARAAGGEVTCVEIRPALAEILKLKDYPTANEDFLTWCLCDQYDEETGESSRPLFDKVVMNPPFEKGQDMKHVLTAYELCLKPGGRLVALMGEGAFFRSDSQAKGFRQWLDAVGGTSERLPEGSFAAAGEVNRTGTAARIVIIDKQED